MINRLNTTVKEFFLATRDSYSYNIFLNTYIWFGILWGLPIPIVSTFFEARLTGCTGFLESIYLASTTPFQWFFFAHPIIFGILFGILGSIRKRKDNQVNSLIEELHNLSNIDALTGLNNRRFFTQSYLTENARAERMKEPLAILLMDIDHFKLINDNHGHIVGDEVLKATGQFLQSQSRPYDIPARWGGEEFVILLPKTDETQANILAERIRKDFTDNIKSLFNMNITISIGISQYYIDDSIETFTERADKALYQAKDNGRNRCVTWSSLKPIE